MPLVFQPLNNLQRSFRAFCSTLYVHNHSHISISQKHNDSIPPYLSGADDSTVQLVKQHLKVHENFVSEAEEIELMKEIDPILKRRRYEKDHWDAAIRLYKETEKTNWNEINSKVIQRLRDLAFPEKCSQIRSVHVLDLAKDGYIKPHVDSIRFCGDTIAGISLLSTSVMRLVMEDNKDIYIDVLLPRCSLYIMKGIVRYNFSHEILEDSKSYFKGKQIPRDRRISVICRNEPVQNG